MSHETMTFVDTDMHTAAMLAFATLNERVRVGELSEDVAIAMLSDYCSGLRARVLPVVGKFDDTDGYRNGVHAALKSAHLGLTTLMRRNTWSDLAGGNSQSRLMYRFVDESVENFRLYAGVLLSRVDESICPFSVREWVFSFMESDMAWMKEAHSAALKCCYDIANPVLMLAPLLNGAEGEYAKMWCRAEGMVDTWSRENANSVLGKRLMKEELGDLKFWGGGQSMSLVQKKIFKDKFWSSFSNRRIVISGMVDSGSMLHDGRDAEQFLRLLGEAFEFHESVFKATRATVDYLRSLNELIEVESDDGGLNMAF